MPLRPLKIFGLLSFITVSATQNFPDIKPELGKYQDLSQIYPLTEAYYLMYRNYEEDPVFGTFKCISLTQTGPEQEGGHPVKAAFGKDDQSATGLVKLESSEGYSAKNKALFTADGASESQVVTLVFGDEGKCFVVRTLYVKDDACCVAVPESQLGKNTTSCDFVFDMLCGGTKYYTYDDDCKN